MEIQDHPLKIVQHYCLKQEAGTQDWLFKSFKYYFIEGLWEVGEGEEGIHEWMGEENSDTEKAEISKAEVPVVPPTSHPTPTF